MIYSQGVK